MKKQTLNQEWKPHLSFAGLIISLASEITKQGKRELRKNRLHLSYGRIGVLATLLTGPHTQAILAQKLGQKPPSMMEMLERLEKERLVQSSSDPADGRKFNWILTSKGAKDAKLAREVIKNIAEAMEVFFRKHKIREKEIERFKEILILILREQFKRNF